MVKHIRSAAFNDKLRTFLHDRGRSQKDLAQAINLHEKVLSRKFSEHNKADFSEDDVRKIITTFAQWRFINTREEVEDWLALAEMEPDSFSEQDWRKSPLNLLLGRKHQAGRLNYPLSHPTNHNLPNTLTRLVGREQVVDNLYQILGHDDARLVTLTGSGGCGKTRLALHVAHEIQNLFAHGVWFVDLLATQDAGRVPQTIMQTLHIKHNYPTPLLESLTEYFKNKHLLLILDNFEQVTDAAPVISTLLAESPGLKVLVTSRKVLHIYGEHEFTVPSLDVPDIATVMSMSVEEIASYSAVQLFVERARAILPSFNVNSTNAVSIARICAELDGLPLALELAAARIKVLTPPTKLLSKLSEKRLPILIGGARNLPDKHQTLRNTIDWSYNLLSAEEQRWFARMGIFSNGWTLEAAEAMMQEMTDDSKHTPLKSEHSMLNVLEHLLDNSLLKRILGEDGETRFTMLETLREYALEQLSWEEYTLLSNWHAQYFMSMAEEAEAGLRGKQQRFWHTQLSAERDNLLAALEWSHQQAKVNANMGVDLPAIEVLLRLAAALRTYWEWQGYMTEGRNWLDAALAFSLPENVSQTTFAARAKALSEAARLLCLQNEQDNSQAAAEESIALWQQLDHPHGLAMAQLYCSWSAFARNQYDVAKDLIECSLHLLSSTDDLWIRGQLLFYLGSATGLTGDYVLMREYYARSKAIFEQMGDMSAIADLLKDQSGLALLEEKYDEAITDLLKSIEISYDLGYKEYLGTGIGLLGMAIGARAKPDPTTASLQAAQLWGAADHIFGNIGSNPWLTNIPAAQEKYVQIRFRVSKPQWREAWYAGRAFTEEQAIAACRKFSAL